MRRSQPHRLGFTIGVVVAVASGLLGACGTSTDRTAGSGQPSVSVASSEGDSATGTATIVLRAAPGSDASDVVLDSAVAALRSRLDASGSDAVIERQGSTVRITISGAEGAPSDELVADLIAPGQVYLRPVLECGVAEPSTAAAASDPTVEQVLPTSDGSTCLVGPAQGTGEVFGLDASPEFAEGVGWTVVVSLRSGTEGEDVWNAIAAECFEAGLTCPSSQLAIELDGVVITHPSVQTPSFSGSVQISGSFTEDQAADLARVLHSGALPFAMVVDSVTFNPG